jgi:hypothetical protein
MGKDKKVVSNKVSMLSLSFLSPDEELMIRKVFRVEVCLRDAYSTTSVSFWERTIIDGGDSSGTVRENMIRNKTTKMRNKVSRGHMIGTNRTFYSIETQKTRKDIADRRRYTIQQKGTYLPTCCLIPNSTLLMICIVKKQSYA